MFQFESLQDFLQMSGHGGYVWACYLLTVLLLAQLLCSPVQRQRRFKRRLRQQLQARKHSVETHLEEV